MAHTESTVGFNLMALSYRVRDALKPRLPYLEEAGIRQGMTVLDFGCGSGSYTVPAAQMAGRSGRVYALDRNPAALKATSARAARAKLTTVKTLLSDGVTGLLNGSVDVVLLYDIFHDLEEPYVILGELRRVLKRSGILSAHDHHLASLQLTKEIEASGLFRLACVGALTMTFAPDREGT